MPNRVRVFVNAGLQKPIVVTRQPCDSDDEEEGDEGAQASTVQVVNKPGILVPARGALAAPPPRGWHDAGGQRGRKLRKCGGTS